MEVTCPACAARYSADDNKLMGKTVRMRCKACDTAWLVTGPVHEPMIHASSKDRAAVIRRGAERERRDLFADRGPDLGVVNATIPPPASFKGGVGARNEHSVLFSVDQLAGNARPKTPRSAARSSSDDEGVIDLRALSSVPPPRPAGAVAPLFSEPPPMTVEVAGGMHAASTHASKLRWGAALAGAVAVLGIAGYGIASMFKAEDPVKHAAVAPPPEPPKVEPKIEAPKEPPPAAAPAPTVAEAKDPPKSKKGKGKRGGYAAAKTAGASPKPAAAPKAADPCGCKGDFDCVLACTAKGSR